MTFQEWLPNCLVVRQVRSSKGDVEFAGDGGELSWSELIDHNVKQFKEGAIDWLSPVLFNGHLQTGYTGYKEFNEIDEVQYKRVVVEYPHGGQGAIDFVVTEPLPEGKKRPDTPAPMGQHPFTRPLDEQYRYAAPGDPTLRSSDESPLLIMCHGLTGGSHESYLRPMLSRITGDAYGFEACVVNSRGCCQSAITTPQLYSGGWTNDLRHCVRELRDRFPNRPFYMMGFSLGAAIVANYIGEEGDRCDVKTAVVMSAPWDMVKGQQFLDGYQFGRRIYSPTLCNNLVRLLTRHLGVLLQSPLFKQKWEASKGKLRTVKDFDDYFTGPMFGYRDSQDYYRDASPRNRIPGIRVPLIGINSLDDPIIGGKSIVPEQELQENPYVRLILTNIGGHLGWFKDVNGYRWYTEPVCEYFSAFQRQVVLPGLKPKNTYDELHCKPVKTSFF
ncbi:putative carboxylic ester hydrolase KNAG_0J01980 [Huiozyma naganishii CBS 8797]|uniref:AB hydrolase-1 domain-containing protein n=1 Tax=Huiozyma naganishii (strain ATCC MYA-139 / BCRC 22969 / CBS 8797 / KCTC 17520 / NBRC 10181 / NCYC 3082 / Yp74L-3) TaxID=1071383 RepID=J7S9S8_HUIN7|nr:hypothetical protein KNAG_0J01980 [Kazachstania naganishii CBS 8797]CCK72279.1 hypothetical protein KNAG_0J01980 [Kazachstania naganishii CBS 8797]